MTLETKLLIGCLTLMAVALVYAVLKTCTAWYDHHIVRHDLIAESKRRRFEYQRAIAERDREIAEAEAGGSVIIEEEVVSEPALAA
jgi:hypothetical protein